MGIVIIEQVHLRFNHHNRMSRRAVGDGAWSQRPCEMRTEEAMEIIITTEVEEAEEGEVEEAVEQAIGRRHEGSADSVARRDTPATIVQTIDEKSFVNKRK